MKSFLGNKTRTALFLSFISVVENQASQAEDTITCPAGDMLTFKTQQSPTGTEYVYSGTTVNTSGDGMPITAQHPVGQRLSDINLYGMTLTPASYTIVCTYNASDNYQIALISAPIPNGQNCKQATNTSQNTSITCP